MSVAKTISRVFYILLIFFTFAVLYLTINSSKPSSEPPDAILSEAKSNMSMKEKIKNEIKSMLKTNLIFNSPNKIHDGIPEYAELTLSETTLSIEEAQKWREKDRKIIEEEVSYTPRMRASLISLDDGLEIKEILPASQIINPEKSTTWKWIIHGVKAGTHAMHLEVSALLLDEGTPMIIESFSRDIIVEVSTTKKFLNFLKNNWGTLFALIVAIFAIIIPLYYQRKWSNTALETKNGKSKRKK